jgi:hypothetical protein
MTLPHEQVYSMINTRNFLLDLMSPAKTPRVPAPVRKRARDCLRHFPWEHDIRTILDKVAPQPRNKVASGRCTKKTKRTKT